nr:hypothetical protein [Bradyrhizobium sp. AC87j1]
MQDCTGEEITQEWLYRCAGREHLGTRREGRQCR